jgi:MFS transporter, MCT family, solute carrier family 16 (monocarboxylic acid transporters), member 10
VALINGAAALGRIVLGHCADSFDAWLLAPLSLVLSSATVLVLWGVPSPTAGTLLAFGTVYGLVAGSWFSLWAALIRPIARDDPVLSTTLYGWLLITTGVGAVLSTPIATALVKVGPSVVAHSMRASSGYAVDGGRYERMIVYVGVCFAAAAIMGLAGWCARGKGRR